MGEELVGGRSGNSVSRSGATVERGTGPWSDNVHALLRHLEGVGFRGSPRLLSSADGREVLSFIEGEVLADAGWLPGKPTPWPAWAQTEEALVATGTLLRELHDAVSSFAPVSETWKNPYARTLEAGRVVCHCDIGPHNTVYRDGLPVAFIDWDEIEPRRAITEWAIAAWYYVPLADDAYFAASGFGVTPELARRLRLFADAYGVSDRSTVGSALERALFRVGEFNRAWLTESLPSLLVAF